MPAPDFNEKLLIECFKACKLNIKATLPVYNRKNKGNPPVSYSQLRDKLLSLGVIKKRERAISEYNYDLIKSIFTRLNSKLFGEDVFTNLVDEYNTNCGEAKKLSDSAVVTIIADLGLKLREVIYSPNLALSNTKKGCRKGIPRKFSYVADLADGGSLPAVIGKMCLKCSGGDEYEVVQCQVTDCPLYPFRPFKIKEN